MDLIVGTHGRAIWTIDVTGLEGISKADIEKDVVLTKPQDILLLGRQSRLINVGEGYHLSPNSQPGTRIYYYLKQAAKEVKITISDAGGVRKQEYTGSSKAGLNMQEWAGRLGGTMVEPGDYRVVVNVDGKEFSTSVHVERANSGF
jgi:hypothetical protein